MAVVGKEALVAEWQPYGPALLSVEDESGFLSVDYTDGVDTRWAPQAMLGPLVNTVSCSAAGGTTANASGAALSGTMNATLFIYVIRGTKWAKIQASNMTLISDDTETALAEAATSILYVRNAGGTQEIAIGMDNTPYRVITAVGAGATDTHSANTASTINRILGSAGEGSAVPRIVGLGRSGGAGTAQNTVRANILTSTTTMASPTWATIDTIGPEIVTFTGFALDQDYWIVGTDWGPYYIDSDFNHFRPLMPEIGQSANNCAQLTEISYLGVVTPLNRGALRLQSLQAEGAVGPERYMANTSPVQGRLTGVAGNNVWTWFNVYNPVTTDTWVCAVRPRQSGDWHIHPLSYYPVAKLTATASNFLLDIDTANSTRTNPTLIGGSGANIFWFTQGRLTREPDDSNYRFAASGTLYLTEMRRLPEYDKEVEWVELETSSCSATQTITVSLSVDGGTAVELPAITTNGYQRIPCGPGLFRGTRIKPQVAFVTGASTASPKIEGRLRLIYRVYDKRVDGMERQR